MQLPELNIILDLPPQLTPNDTVAIDLEVFGMKKGKLHRPNQGRFASLQVCFNGKDVYVVTEEEKVKEVIARISPAAPVFHGADFDVRHIRRWSPYSRSDFSDTLGMERILSAGLYDTFGLKDLARHYLSVLVDKKEREEFSTATEMTRDMLRYAALDPYYTWWINQEQQKLVRPQDRYIWETVDRPALLTLLKVKGFKLDVLKWSIQAGKMEVARDNLRKELGFNPGSWQQVKKALSEKGIDVPSTGEEVLRGYKKHPLVGKILEYRYAAHMASTYGMPFIEEFVEDEDLTYPHINYTVASTGRMSADDYNSQNIPNDKEYRGSFIPRDKDHVLLMIDYNSQEPRITAFESQDPNLFEAIQPGKKVHAEVGKRLFHDPTLTKGDPRYKKAKQLNLGLSYGLSAKGLQAKLLEDDIKITEQEAKALVKAYFDNFPGVTKYINDKRDFAFHHGYVETHLGRRSWVNLYNFKWRNNAINAPVQGGGADVLKRAMIRIDCECETAGIDFPMVNAVHDELDFDVHKDCLHEMVQIAERAMIEEAETIYEGIPFEVETSIGNSWAEKE